MSKTIISTNKLHMDKKLNTQQTNQQNNTMKENITNIMRHKHKYINEPTAGSINNLQSENQNVEVNK